MGDAEDVRLIVARIIVCVKKQYLAMSSQHYPKETRVPLIALYMIDLKRMLVPCNVQFYGNNENTSNISYYFFLLGLIRDIGT